jgi:hypothetical protein
MTRHLRLLLVALAILCRANLVHAEAERPVAEVLFAQAREDMRRGDYAAAYSKLLESERLDPANGTRFNLVVCAERLGKVATAWVRARRLLEVLPENDERRPVTQRWVTTLAARLPTLVTRLASSAPPGIRIFLDGVEIDVATQGTPLPVDPGPHQIVVRARGRADRVSELEAEEGHLHEIELQPGEASVVPPSSPPRPASTAPARRRMEPPRAPHARTPRWIGWSALAVGVAAVAGGAVLSSLAVDKKEFVERTCPNKRCREESGLEAGRDGKMLVGAAAAAFAVGAAGLGVGAYFVLENTSSAPPRHPAVGATVAARF